MSSERPSEERLQQIREIMEDKFPEAASPSVFSRSTSSGMAAPRMGCTPAPKGKAQAMDLGLLDWSEKGALNALDDSCCSFYSCVRSTERLQDRFDPRAGRWFV